MTRLPAALTALLALLVLCQDAEKSEPNRLTRAEAERYSQIRQQAQQEETLAEMAGRFRAAYLGTDPARPPLTRSWQLHAGAPAVVHAAEVPVADYLRMYRELDSVEARVTAWKLLGACIRLRDEVRRLRAELELPNDWPEPTEEEGR